MTASCPSIRLYQRRGISINVCLFTDLLSLFAKLPSTSNKCILFFYNKQIHINTHNFSCRSLDKIFRFLDIGCYYYNNNLDLLKVPELKFFARLIGINKLLFFSEGIRRRRSRYDDATDLVTREHWTLDLRGLN